MGKPIGYNPARLQRAFRTIIYFPQTVGLKSNKNNVKNSERSYYSFLPCLVLHSKK